MTNPLQIVIIKSFYLSLFTAEKAIHAVVLNPDCLCWIRQPCFSTSPSTCSHGVCSRPHKEANLSLDCCCASNYFLQCAVTIGLPGEYTTLQYFCQTRLCYWWRVVVSVLVTEPMLCCCQHSVGCHPSHGPYPHEQDT